MSIRVLHPRMQVHGADVRAEHVDGVELRVPSVLDSQVPPGIGPRGRHGHGLARPVDDLGAVEGQRAHGLRVLAVGAADGADVADVGRPQHRVERVDAVAEELDPAVVDVVRRAGALAAPEVVLRRLVHHLAARGDDEQRVEVAVVHDLGPARLALHDDVGVVELRGPRRGRSVSSPGMSMKRSRAAITCGDVERLVGEAGQRALGEGDRAGPAC